MQAYTYISEGKFELVEKEKPIIIHERDAIVKVTLVIGFNAKVQEMLKPMTAVYKSGVVDALSSVGKAYANMNLGITQSEMIKV